MAKVILICGKLCSGKTHYSQSIRKQRGSVLLSCDEIEAMIFHHSLGERHDEVAADIQAYLYKKSLDIVSAGTDVILDWGFWKRSEREKATELYRRSGVEAEWHYVSISDESWTRNIAERNRAVAAHKSDDYFIDEGLLEKIKTLFEIPDRSEIDVWYENLR